KEGPLGFLGQIALSDLTDTQVAHSLPREGLLSFFAFQSFESGHQPGAFPEIAGDTCILHTRESETLKRRQPTDGHDEGNAILPACQRTMREGWDLPDISDNLPRKLAAELKKLQKGDRGGALDKLRSKVHEHFGHPLLGYSVPLRTSDLPPAPE